jgi:hypothetical protein
VEHRHGGQEGVDDGGTEVFLTIVGIEGEECGVGRAEDGDEAVVFVPFDYAGTDPEEVADFGAGLEGVVGGGFAIGHGEYGGLGPLEEVEGELDDGVAGKEVARIDGVGVNACLGERTAAEVEGVALAEAVDAGGIEEVAPLEMEGEERVAAIGGE